MRRGGAGAGKGAGPVLLPGATAGAEVQSLPQPRQVCARRTRLPGAAGAWGCGGGGRTAGPAGGALLPAALSAGLGAEGALPAGGCPGPDPLRGLPPGAGPRQPGGGGAGPCRCLEPVTRPRGCPPPVAGAGGTRGCTGSHGLGLKGLGWRCVRRGHGGGRARSSSPGGGKGAPGARSLRGAGGRSRGEGCAPAPLAPGGFASRCDARAAPGPRALSRGCPPFCRRFHRPVPLWGWCCRKAFLSGPEVWLLVLPLNSDLNFLEVDLVLCSG